MLDDGGFYSLPEYLTESQDDNAEPERALMCAVDSIALDMCQLAEVVDRQIGLVADGYAMPEDLGIAMSAMAVRELHRLAKALERVGEAQREALKARREALGKTDDAG